VKISLPLGLLGPGKLKGVLVDEGPNPRSFASRPVTLKVGQ